MLLSKVLNHLISFCRSTIALNVLLLLKDTAIPEGKQQAVQEAIEHLSAKSQQAALDLAQANPLTSRASHSEIYAALWAKDYDGLLGLLRRTTSAWPPMLLPYLIRHNYIGVMKELVHSHRAALAAYLESDATADDCQVVEAFRQLVEDSGIREVRWILLLGKVGWRPDPLSAHVLFDMALRHNWLPLFGELVQRDWVEWNRRLPGHFASPLVYAAMAGRSTLFACLEGLQMFRCSGDDCINVRGYRGEWRDDGESWLPPAPVLRAIRGAGVLPPIPGADEDSFIPAKPPIPVFNRRLRNVKDPQTTLIQPGWSALKIALANWSRGGSWDVTPAILALNLNAKALPKEEMLAIMANQTAVADFFFQKDEQAELH